VVRAWAEVGVGSHFQIKADNCEGSPICVGCLKMSMWG
jgi:hypothetical protein